MSRDIYSDAELICQSIEVQTEVLREMVPLINEARLRLTCAALAGSPVAAAMPDTVATHAVAVADACLALLYPKPPEGEVPK